MSHCGGKRDLGDPVVKMSASRLCCWSRDSILVTKLHRTKYTDVHTSNVCIKLGKSA